MLLLWSALTSGVDSPEPFMKEVAESTLKTTKEKSIFYLILCDTGVEAKYKLFRHKGKMCTVLFRVLGGRMT